MMRMLNAFLFALALHGGDLDAARESSRRAGAGAATGVPATASTEQEALLRAGIALHDTGEFEGAIAKYQTPAPVASSARTFQPTCAGSGIRGTNDGQRVTANLDCDTPAA